MKFERDKSVIKKIIEVALEVAGDEQVPIIDRLTRLRAAVFWAGEVALDATKLKEAEIKLCGF